MEYADDGLEVIGMDANDTLSQIGQVEDFCSNLGVTYNIGLEDDLTTTYAKFAANFEGLNPFPVTVLVGKDRKVRYVAREYDGDALTTAIEEALAE